MQNIVKSMLDEVGAMMSGHVIPYHKVAIVVAAVIALLFSLVFSHSTVFEGKIAVIDLDASNYSTALIQKINTSPYIEVTQVLHSPMNPEILTAHDRNIGVLYIPKGLEKSLKTGDRTVRLGYFADHSNSAQNAEVLQNLNEYIPELGAELGAEHIAALGFGREGTEAVLSPMQLKNRHLFNPTNTATNSTSIAFVYFFSSLFYGLATLMVVGRLKVTGTWDQAVFNRGPLALMCRMVPYAFFYTTGITMASALLVTFGQLRFEGNYFAYLPTIFMTGLAFGWLALILSWSTQNPGEGASLMTFLVPPGFILGGATMAVGFLPLWAYYISYAFPLVWQYRFYRDFAMRGQTLAQMLPTYGAYLIFLTVIASVVVLLYYRTKRQVEAG
ncbi:ABC transporter permease [Yersinia enterocolitica]|nr:ABC transporter permease [Yersinia enterocolitica]EHB19437.1 ABC-type multidrug transport system, permease component [Yersinia enterocolitica subsp. palearctica PhRBD_Ye1]EOR68941.1 ABC-type multidrug transport system,permease component [Yersinia enterocolitica subsp. palearctica YE-149]EOR79454.1 ABC-type multidrug transport system,permease component [Yersinia enterocolitica subsp. palearctica YE-P1]EOR79515.1 ABC-type multidrug transport system,permease component [Yersinia enterocolitica s